MTNRAIPVFKMLKLTLKLKKFIVLSYNNNSNTFHLNLSKLIGFCSELLYEANVCLSMLFSEKR